MMRDMTFGQYYPTESFVHKLDPRIKILLLIAYIAMIFTAQNFISLGVAIIFMLVSVFASRVPLTSVLKSIKAIIFLVIFTAVINVFFYRKGEGDHALFWIVTREGLINAGFLAIRLVSLVAGSSVLTLTTTPVSLTDGIESLLKPLSLVKFPVHELALIMSIALRFIPTLADETDRIINAQKARGADFESGNVFSRVKALIPVLIPLLVSAFRRADELGDAMDARCYSGAKKRTKYKKLKIGARDIVAVLFAGAAIAGIILTNIYYSGIISCFSALFGV
ncbi:MAG TPA: transporter [Clostridiales bacterium]|nr:transporter [Clostridiales bacterium]